MKSVGLPSLVEAVRELGKPSWRPMLSYVAGLHSRSIHPAEPPFPFSWEEIGPGYCYGPAFGHWDLVHAVLDVVHDEPRHAYNQLLNLLSVQSDGGMLPGVVWMPRPDDPTRQEPRWSQRISHPPVWPFAVEALSERQSGDDGLIARAYDPLVRQLHWFEVYRKADPYGFYYADILTFDWESGIDEGVRFDHVQPGPLACVDATSQVYALYDFAERWGGRLGTAAGVFGTRALELKAFIQRELFCEETGFFHDVWAVSDPTRRRLALEGIWPLVVGAASASQAQRVIDENLLNPDRFLTTHPVSTVALADPSFELRMWRGPTWNSMTYWAALGCCRYGREDAAQVILEQALDQTSSQYARTGTIWEFYHPEGKDPLLLHRKPRTPYDEPCRDYLGHNPLIAMARLYDSLSR